MGACNASLDTVDARGTRRAIQAGYSDVFEVVTDTRDSKHARVTGALRRDKEEPESDLSLGHAFATSARVQVECPNNSQKPRTARIGDVLVTYIFHAQSRTEPVRVSSRTLVRALSRRVVRLYTGELRSDAGARRRCLDRLGCERRLEWNRLGRLGHIEWLRKREPRW